MRMTVSSAEATISSSCATAVMPMTARSVLAMKGPAWGTWCTASTRAAPKVPSSVIPPTTSIGLRLRINGGIPVWLTLPS